LGLTLAPSFDFSLGMKLHKLQAALKKAQAAEKSAKAAYEKIISRTGLISEA